MSRPSRGDSHPAGAPAGRINSAEPAGAPAGGSHWRVLRPFDVTEADLAARWRELFAGHPGLYTELVLLHRNGAALDRLLRDEIGALETLFAAGSAITADQLYQDSPSFLLHNRVVAATVLELVASLPPGRALRILEVGAGTGGVTAHVLGELPADRTEYVFTDVSQAFLTAAARRFRDHELVSYEILDLEADPLEQGFEAGSFDLVIASDVVHATADVRRSLTHVDTLLAPGGALILIEPETDSPIADLLFGLTEGWWRFADHELRPDHPLLPERRWREVLGERFADVTCVWSGEKLAAWSAARELTDHLVCVAKGPRGARPNAEAAAGGRAPAERWLILADRGGFADRFVERLATRGIAATATAADGAERLRAALAEAADGEPPLTRVVHLRSLDCTPTAELAPADLPANEALTCAGIVELVRAIRSLEGAARPAIEVVTRGMQPIDGAAAELALAQAPVWGIVGSAAQEHPGLDWRLIDLDPADDPGRQAELLIAEALSGDAENAVGFRNGGRRYVARLRRTTLVETPAAERIPVQTASRYRLALSASGILDRLRFREAAPHALTGRQVEVAVRAAALNFRDVLKVLGLYPMDNEDYLLLGDECAGVVSAVGPEVERVAVGDPVVAVGPAALASHMVTLEEMLLPKPGRLTFEEAATLPIAFLTAWYCLRRVARLAPGERVLIHAAAGGVGLAAVQIAQEVGAEVYATASSGKRELLRLLGVERVMDSRSLDFGDEILEATGGEGVDVILNSLAGAAIDKGLAILAPNGRFVEIGKRDVYENRRVGLRGLRENASLHVIDMSRVLAGDPKRLRELMDGIVAALDDGALHALPHRLFPPSRVVDAFRTMAQGRHVGKIVVTFEQHGLRVDPAYPSALAARPDASYLVTGGLGGFGLEIARGLLFRGAGCVVLVGRSGAASPRAREGLAALERDFPEARIEVVAADAADHEAMAAIFRRFGGPGEDSLPALAGVVHAAMVLDDRPLEALDAASIRRVMAPKADAAWILHRLTEALDLDFFFMTSTFASVMGSLGQGNYAAANAFLDRLAHYRRARGLPAAVVNWGPLADVGTVAESEELAERLAARGAVALPTRLALRILEQTLVRGRVQLAAARVDWQRWHAASNRREVPPMLSEVFEEAAVGADEAETRSRVLGALRAATEAERPGIAEAYLAQQIAKVLGTTPDKIDRDAALQNLGLDSLMAVELQNRIESHLGITLSTAKVVANPTIRGLAAVLLARLEAERAEGAAHAPAFPAAEPAAGAAAAPEDGREPADSGNGDGTGSLGAAPLAAGPPPRRSRPTETS